MNLAFVLPPNEPYSPRGLALSTIVWHVSAELGARGHSVMVVSPDDAEGLYDTPRVVAVSARPRPWAVRRIRGRLGRAQGWDWPDQDRWHRRVVAALKAEHELDAVVVMNDLQVHRAVQRSLPRVIRATWLENEINTRVSLDKIRGSIDCFMCCSEFIVGTVRGRVGRDTAVVVVNNCVDTSQFSPIHSDRAEAWIPRLLFVGRLDPNKGPDALVSAAREARSHGVQAEVRVAGPEISYSLSGTAYEAWIAAMLDDLRGIGGQYLGRVQRPDLPGLYRDHDATFVLSRSEEPFGMVALEAMACGNLVVASNRGGLVEATGGHAVYVDPDDVGSIARMLKRFADDPSEFDAQRKAGTQWAATRGWHVAAAALTEALDAATTK